MNLTASSQTTSTAVPWPVSSRPLRCDCLLNLDVGQLQVPPPKLPAFIHQKLRMSWSGAVHELTHRLSIRPKDDPVSLRDAVDAFTDKVIEAHKLYLGHVVVKVKPGKTDLSRQVYLKVKPVPREGYPVAPMANAMKASARWIYVPATLVHVEGETSHLPLWFVQNKADELEKKSTRQNGTWRYKVENEIVWLDAAGFRSFIEAQLPADMVAHCLRVKAETEAQELLRQQSQQEQAILMAENRVKSAAEAKLSAAAKAAADAKAKARLNALPGWTGVNVDYCDWERKGGKFTRIDQSATNVTVRQSGLRAYIIFDDGTTLLKPTKNVEVTDYEGNPLVFSG